MSSWQLALRYQIQTLALLYIRLDVPGVTSNNGGGPSRIPGAEGYDAPTINDIAATIIFVVIVTAGLDFIYTKSRVTASVRGNRDGDGIPGIDFKFISDQVVGGIRD